MAILVHDEILGEVPFVTAKKAIPIFQQCMLASANDLRTGAKCDVASSFSWYGDDYLLEELNDELLKKKKEEFYS